MLPIVSVIMEVLGIVFTNFIFETFLSHEALVAARLRVTNNTQMQHFR